MRVLGIESSCDECAASVVEDGHKVLSNVIATQIPFHAAYNGVVPEIASRKHTEWIYAVVKEALDKAGMKAADVDAVAATARPGLLGSLLVGLSFAKAFAWARDLPFVAVDHMLAHLYASRLDQAFSKGEEVSAAEYPFLGLLVSGGHSIICKVDAFDDITVLGTTIDDAVGEAFDKVSKHYGFGYPGGAVIDKLAESGNARAFNFPLPSLHKGDHRYDVSYSGLKNAVINQFEQFRALPAHEAKEIEEANIAASFQRTAVEILARSLFNAVQDTGLHTIVAGGGVAANSLLRARLAERQDLRCIFPPLELCGDNGAMVAGIAYRYLERGEASPLTVTASARVKAFKRRCS
ncbi:tRNA (adenosine(37)-N6)-threonylcarbamoyltransferase complex transferase subunit TsaD [Leadbettera azotonutricia]|uniref:tRNA N6-adenosine threonylcarbamoyltransferase n=1 Tax=Leadbettera azotonutricia (strain ATCC BAA-888 / DSM 13862 / ZAS-9) TaxID=545695 RepID=F5YF83_LEAAZ|nr:tRNA (adenosine(37)-N6)-threonylcarbamoyltransferase complex transferase subunit TsaD [Leadbettera azotonutricia]AEF81672.1 probable O-sialoglycoprotein endopeptidase (Glycoprotease) [Leadbettera azotonutricia ZAS-9]